MEAMIQVSEADLTKIRKMGIEILCTDKDAIFPSPFTFTAIQAEVRRYLHLHGTGKETVSRIKSLVDAAMRRMEKALQTDGSLNWDEVWEIIEDCYARLKRDKDQ